MLQQAIKTIRTLLPQTTSVTQQEISDAVNIALMAPQYKNLDRDALTREVESLFNIRMDDFRIIEDAERRKPWVAEIRSKTKWTFWSRYKDYLTVEKNYAETVLDQIDKLTDRTLDGLFDPNEKIIVCKKGLVVGHVQSGKTSNYTGLICKAADAGYKLIIVLAGIHNNLRSQTQLRLDEGFLGFDTQHQRAYDRNGVKIGVGEFNQDGVAHSLTSSLDNGDFATKTAISMGGVNFNTSEPIIAVVKKNSTVLDRLKTWLSAQAETLPDGTKKIRTKSLLLIDDEADNASINTNKDDDTATRINQHIKDILDLFDRSGYVGYTATPFANIFIPIKEDDLFPRDFIINLPSPSNYIGPAKVFGISVLEDNEANSSVLPIVNRVDDYKDFIANGHKKDGYIPDQLPESLELAIRCFIITCAVRRLRGHEKAHNSMLIHVSRFTRWQKHIRDLVEKNFNYYKRGIEANVPQILEKFRKTFEEDYEYTTEDKSIEVKESYKSYKTVSKYIIDNMPDVDSQVKVHEWKEVLPFLKESASRIEVREINGGSGDVLNYYDHKDGLSVIAVGGNKLSRGLTLEGLSVSYYLRASRMYDTLMQMGRWFGYRPGYVDLCRLFTSRELNEWFCHITMASEELRNEFTYMSEVAGSTPEQYALRVRTHPGQLQISASNKIRRAVTIQVSWAGRLVESYQLQKKHDTVESNLKITKDLINSLPKYSDKRNNHYIWRNISVEQVRPFFRNFKVSENLKNAEPSKLLDYIEVANRNGELVNWNIVLRFKNNAEKVYDLASSNGIDKIGCIIRMHDDKKEDDENLHIRRNHIISPRDEFFDLTEDEFEKGLVRSKELDKNYKNDYPKGEVVRNEIRSPKTALLMLYYINPKSAELPEESDPIVGFAVSFPKSYSNPTVTYAVNEQLLSKFDIYDDIENDNNDEN